MKTWKLTLLLFGAALFFSQCEKETVEMSSAEKSYFALGMEGPGDADCVVTQTLWAGAGKNDTSKGTNVGELTAWIDGSTLIVKYSVAGTLTEVHLWVGTEVTQVPKNAAPGQFPFKSGPIYQSNYLFNVDLGDLDIMPGDDFYVAAHGVIINHMVTEDLELPETANVFVKYYNHEPKFDDSYFLIDIDQGGILDGLNYEGWCVDIRTAMQFEGDYNPFLANVHTSYGTLPLAKINYLLNLNLEGFTLMDIQLAIWKLIEGEGFTEETLKGFPLAFGSVSGYDWEKVMQLVDMANLQGDYVPGCGEKLVIVLTNDYQQDVIITIPVPCKGDDTIWAFGEETFIENNIAKKWGWLFEVNCY